MNKSNLIRIIAFLAALAIIYIAILNVADTITLQVWGPSVDAASGTVIHSTKNINTAFFTFVVFAIGLFVGIALFMPFYSAQEDKLNAYKRELEKSSVMTDASTSEVKVLQAKVAVLEKALKDALNG